MKTNFIKSGMNTYTVTFIPITCQKEYTQKVLNCFGMTSTNQVCAPLTAPIRLSELNSTQLESKKKYISRVPYASVVGSLMYVMVCTESNLAQTINVVCRYMGNPGEENWQVMKHICRYLKGTTDIGLIYYGDTCSALVG